MHYFTQITSIRETEQGTDLIVHIPSEQLRNTISKYSTGNKVDAEIRINDGRTITAEQRKKVFATIKDISLHTGDDPEFLRKYLLYDYCSKSGEIPFSLSDCSITQAREYINHIIDFVLEQNIPLTSLGVDRTDDIDRYLYGCIKYKKCCICGKDGELHHCTGSRIGIGNNRKKTSNEGRELISLCRKHHTEIHTMPEGEFFKKYHVNGVVWNEGRKGSGDG